MKRITKLFALASLALVPLAAVAEPGHHGDNAKLGTVEVVGHKLVVTKMGAIEPGKEAAFQVAAVEAGKKLTDLNIYLWLEDTEGKQVSAAGKGISEAGALHFHVTPKAGTAPKNVVVRIRAEGKDEKGALPLDGHGHAH